MRYDGKFINNNLKIKIMNRLLLSVIMSVSFLAAAAQIKVVDRSDGSAVPFASVITADGRMLGMTDEQGLLPEEADTVAEFCVRHICYETFTAGPSDRKRGLIELTPQLYDVGSVTVRNSPHEYLRMRSYCRYYSSDTKDSVRIYTESIVDYYMPLNKKKKKKAFTKIRAVRNYGIIKLFDRDSTYYNEGPQQTSSECKMKGVFSDKILLINDKKYSKINRSATVDVLNGKHYPKAVYRRNADVTTFQCDLLADKKDHSYGFWGLKLLGITMEVSDAVVVDMYRTNAANTFGLSNMIGRSFTMTMTLGHKFMTKMYGSKFFSVKSNKEMYFTDMVYMSEAEARAEQEASLTGIKIEVPAHAPKLGVAIEKLKAEVMAHVKQKSAK